MTTEHDPQEVSGRVRLDVPVLLGRHGQTEWNLIGRRQGQLDSPLTERGLDDARSLAGTVAGLGVDRIFSSPLGRALTTARVVAETLTLPVEVLDDLAEVHHGGFAGLTDEELHHLHAPLWRRRAADKYRWRFPQGESYRDASGRAARALSRVVVSDRPLIVSHEMIGRMLRRHLRGLPSAEALTLKHPHRVVYRVFRGTEDALVGRTVVDQS